MAKYSEKAGEKVEKAIHEKKAGTTGKASRRSNCMTITIVDIDGIISRLK